jgi:hypothetical protein
METGSNPFRLHALCYTVAHILHLMNLCVALTQTYSLPTLNPILTPDTLNAISVVLPCPSRQSLRCYHDYAINISFQILYNSSFNHPPTTNIIQSELLTA